MALIDGLTSDSLVPGKDAGAPEEIMALPEPKNPDDVDEDNLKYGALVAFVESRFSKARDKRRWDEDRWLTAYNNYRGLYGPEVQFTDTEKSQAFVKVTKTKVLAAQAQIQDILFSANKFPIGVEASPVVEGIVESVHFDPKAPENNQGPTGPAPGSATIARPELIELLGPVKKVLEPIKDKLKEGPGVTPTAITYEPAKEAARNMEKLIHDQLMESQADKSIRSFAFELSLFGTGMFKGPFAVNKEYPKWDAEGQYNPTIKTIPEATFLSIWDAYPDADARNMMECEWFIERHRLNRSQLRALKKRPHFRAESIEKAIGQGTNYTKEHWENTLEDYETHGAIDRYIVLEYWGILDKDIAEQAGVEIPEQMEHLDEVQVNVWTCNSKILRIVLNPFKPSRIPYFACPYETNPYSFFGIGVAENMEDTQLLMNGFMRQAVDNNSLSSNVILEVDEGNLVAGQDKKLYPGKTFYRQQGSAPGSSINAINIPNTAQQSLLLFDKARQLADEATGMPSYSHGISGVMGTGRTASGMSMLMSAAKENIKAVVRNIDDYLLVPLGKSMFAFNMQFNFDEKYVGDLEVVARGTESLMRNEIRSQKLMQFLQIASNPMDAPYVKRDVILRELAASLDLEPEKIVNDPREATIQATLMAEMQKIMGVQIQGQGNPAGAPGVGDPTQTGGGNVAPGAAPSPGSQGFTGSGGGVNSPPPAQPQSNGAPPRG